MNLITNTCKCEAHNYITVQHCVVVLNALRSFFIILIKMETLNETVLMGNSQNLGRYLWISGFFNLLHKCWRSCTGSDVFLRAGLWDWWWSWDPLIPWEAWSREHVIFSFSILINRLSAKSFSSLIEEFSTVRNFANCQDWSLGFLTQS